MSGLHCRVCGQLNHVGLSHVCDHPELPELMRRMERARRANDRAAETAATFNSGASFSAAWAAATSYHVIQVPPRDTSPIRVQAYVGHRLAEIETRGAQVIEGELA
jgi:hypothetical protein